jgi:hypothetical protein
MQLSDPVSEKTRNRSISPAQTFRQPYRSPTRSVREMTRKN